MLYDPAALLDYWRYQRNTRHRVAGRRWSFTDNPIARYVCDYFRYDGQTVLEAFIGRAFTVITKLDEDGAYRRMQIPTPVWVATLMEDLDDTGKGAAITIKDCIALLEPALTPQKAA